MSDRLPGSGVPRSGGKLSERGWTFLMAGLVFLVGSLSYLWHSSTPTQSKPTAPTMVTPGMVPLATGEEPLDQLFRRAGCTVCHTIPGIAGADGKQGPKLVLAVNGPQRLRDPGYQGYAKTVREYIQESILAPSVYVVPGYPDRVMPRWYGKKLSAAALDKMAEYLESVAE